LRYLFEDVPGRRRASLRSARYCPLPAAVKAPPRRRVIDSIVLESYRPRTGPTVWSRGVEAQR